MIGIPVSSEIADAAEARWRLAAMEHAYPGHFFTVDAAPGGDASRVVISWVAPWLIQARVAEAFARAIAASSFWGFPT
jgi:hypothetical protein